MMLFISHAASDGAHFAVELALALEAINKRSWYAPRDTIPALPFTAQLIEGIEKSEGVVLLMTPGINESTHVPLELEAALEAKRLIAPVMVRPTSPIPRIAYCLGANHRIQWTEAQQVAEALLATFSGASGTDPNAKRRVPTMDHIAAVARKVRP